MPSYSSQWQKKFQATSVITLFLIFLCTLNLTSLQTRHQSDVCSLEIFKLKLTLCQPTILDSTIMLHHKREYCLFYMVTIALSVITEYIMSYLSTFLSILKTSIYEGCVDCQTHMQTLTTIDIQHCCFFQLRGLILEAKHLNFLNYAKLFSQSKQLVFISESFFL